MKGRFLLFLLIIVLAEVYSFIAVRSALKPLSQNWRVGILIFYVLFSIFIWAGFLMFRQINWEEMNPVIKNVWIAFTIGFFVAKIFVGAVMLIDDLRRLLLWTIGALYSGPVKTTGTEEANSIPRSVFLKRTAFVIGGLTLGGFLWGINNRYRYHVRRLKLSFDNLPASFKGMKIVQISDIHSGSFDNHEAVAKGAELVMKEQPDIIFFTGDLVNNKADEIEPYKDIFAKLSAPMGIYSTLGNHDYGDYIEWPNNEVKKQNLDTLKQSHADMGWKLMMNEHKVLERGGDKIAIVGIENWGAKAGFPKYGDMKQAYNGLAEQNIPFKILLSHDPSHWSAEVTKEYTDIDLTLSGHTHGMQFGVEIPGIFKWSPVKFVYEHWAGLYNTGKQHLYVNRGFGFLGYPGRVGILPEITVIELT